VNSTHTDRTTAGRVSEKDPARRKRRFRRFVGYLFALVLIAGVASLIAWQASQRSSSPSGGPRFGMGGGPGGGPGRFARGGGDMPVPVLVASARIADVPVYFDGVGTTRALNTVTVRPQVDGKLISINFREGQDVERGFVLAEIDPTTYQAALDQAVAKKAQDQAQLANARIDLERYTRLAESNAATKQQADTQKALVAQLEAQVKSDQGAIDNTQAILAYTKIIAPISGRTGIRLIDVGNIVRAADTTGLVVITQIRPISILFTLPQQQLSDVNKAFMRGPLPVLALGGDNRTVVDRGTLQVIDNQVDQTTGTVKLKAEFPNAELQLWPGQFVNVKLLVDTLQRVVVVPTAAAQRGPNGTFVYVVNEANTVSVRPVTVSQQDDVQAVITSGLQNSERVVTSGFAQLSEGARITVGGEGAEPAAPPAAGGRGRRGGGNLQSGEPPSPGQQPPGGQRRNQRTEGAGRPTP
jgi:multidrug efflux system membrane fusion protein